VIALRLVAGLSTFAGEIAGRNLVVWSDNTGAEAATRKGPCAPLAFVRVSHDYVAPTRRDEELRPELPDSRDLEEIGAAGHQHLDPAGADEG